MTNGDNNSKFFFLFKDQNKNKIKKYKKRNNFYTEKSIKSTFGVRLLLCVQFICIEEAYLPGLAAITAQQSRIKHSENINYKALQNNRKEENL